MRLDELETLLRGEGPDPADYLEALLREERKEKRDIRRQLEEVMLRLTAALGEPPFGPEVISDPEERERQIAAFRGAGLFGEPSGTEVQQTTSKPST